MPSIFPFFRSLRGLGARKGVLAVSRIARTFSAAIPSTWRSEHPIPQLPSSSDALPMHETTLSRPKDKNQLCFCYAVRTAFNQHLPYCRLRASHSYGPLRRWIFRGNPFILQVCCQQVGCHTGKPSQARGRCATCSQISLYIIISSLLGRFLQYAARSVRNASCLSRRYSLYTFLKSGMV